MNITLNLTNSQYQTLLCPDCMNIYMSWYKAYIILFGITLFLALFIYIYMDLQLMKEQKKNLAYLKGMCPHVNECLNDCNYK